MEFEKLQSIIAEVMDMEEDEITMDTTMDDLGADSLDVAQIAMGIEQELDVELPQESIARIVTVGDVLEEIKNAMN